MKPIAIDLGRNYWVLARMDAYGQPEVASVGEGGQIPAVISEYNGELLLGQRVSEENGPPPLQDFFRLLSGDPESLRALQDRIRDNEEGESEIFLGNEWRTVSGLLTHMLHFLVPLVREQGDEASDVPVVVAVPPGLSQKVLFLLRKAIDQSGFQLLTWCTIPQAMVYCDPQLSQMDDLLVLTMHVEAGALLIGLVKIERGFPVLLHHSSLDWAHDFPLPVGQVGPLLQRFLGEIREQFDLSPNDIDKLLLGGESSWLTHLQGIASDVLSSDYTPFHRPQFSVAMGASILAGWMQEGLLLTPPPEQTSHKEVTLRGFTTPGAQLYVKSGMESYNLEIGLDGVLEVTVALLPDQLNSLEITLERLDGQRFAYRMNVQHETSAEPELVSALGEEQQVPAEISTQPDLEVPEEMLSGTEFIVPAPSLHEIEEAILDEEGDEITSGEGGIETRIVSRETLLKGDFSKEERAAVMDVLSVGSADDEFELITTGQFHGLVEEETGQFDGEDVVDSLHEIPGEEPIVEASLDDIVEEAPLEEVSQDAPSLDSEKTPAHEMPGIELLSDDDHDLEIVEVEDLDVVGVEEVEEDTPVHAESENEEKVILEVMDLDSADHSQLLQDSVEDHPRSSPSEEEISSVVLEEITMDPLPPSARAVELMSTSVTPPTTNTEQEASLRDTTPPASSLRDTGIPQLEEDDEMASLREEMASLPLHQELNAEEETMGGSEPEINAAVLEQGLAQEEVPDSQDSSLAPELDDASERVGPVPAAPSESEEEALSTPLAAEEFEESAPLVEATQDFEDEETPFPVQLLGDSEEASPSHLEQEPLKESVGDFDPISTQPVSSYDDLEAAALVKKSTVETQLQAQRQELFPEAEGEEVEVQSEPAIAPADLAQLARERVEQHKQRRSEEVTASEVDEGASQALAAKLERARLLASEARELLEEVQACSELVDELFPPSLREIASRPEEESDAPIARREIRKLLELSQTLGEVESNRLAASSRKAMLRLARELQDEFDAGNTELCHQLGLQLANRMFDLIRRDLRPW